MRQSERNTEIIRRSKAGEGPTAIARQMGMKRDRVRQIITLAKHREKYRAELVERYGETPKSPYCPTIRPLRCWPSVGAISEGGRRE